MIYPDNFEDKIGFSKIRSLLQANCLCTAGLQYVDEIGFKTGKEQITDLLTETSEMLEILRLDSGFPASDYIDLTELVKGFQIQGSVADLEEIFTMKLSFRTLEALRSYFEGERVEKYPSLAAKAGIMPELAIINEKIATIINEKGEIRDKASEELARIRKESKRLLMRSREKLSSIIARSKQAGWTPPELDLTFRAGRLVIPVYATHKRKIKGFVHDASATEKTVFLEPAEVLDINNEIRELEYLEKEEIRRILKAFTELLRPDIPLLLDAYKILGEYDGLRAKAVLAIDIGAVVPTIGDHAFIDWLDARHPLLYLSHLKQSKAVVPFDLELGEDQRVLIISGPNAGGKSVCLKSIGLIQYLVQCGLAVPMRETSECGIFSKIFIDIGDEQSIENDLSTYSSHLKNIKYFIENATESTLFLIDEFGSGTEPQAGGALAEIALEELSKAKAFGAVTTHYTNLKLLAEKLPGLVNGAMLFDTDDMQPLYRLSTGKPGTSFAFEIARSTGLSDDIIARAIDKAGSSQYDFEKQLQAIDLEKIRLEAKATELKVADDFLAEMIDKYEKLLSEVNTQKTRLRKEAKQDAKLILDDANKLIEKTIREIKESQAEKTAVRKARKTFEKARNELKDKPLPTEPEEPKTVMDPKTDTGLKHDTTAAPKPEHPIKPKVVRKAGIPEVGDQVRIKGLNTVAEVIESSKGMLVLLSQNTKISVKAGQVERVEIQNQGPEHAKRDPRIAEISQQINERSVNFSPVIDIRGVRADAARELLEQYIDEAIMVNAIEVRILHGKGDGILRSVARDYLSARKDVKRCRDEHVEHGGHGITIVELLT